MQGTLIVNAASTALNAPNIKATNYIVNVPSFDDSLVLIPSFIDPLNDQMNLVYEDRNKNKETIFSIDKIIFFSSCDSKNKNTSKTNLTIENLYAYTDIAIF